MESSAARHPDLAPPPAQGLTSHIGTKLQCSLRSSCCTDLVLMHRAHSLAWPHAGLQFRRMHHFIELDECCAPQDCSLKVLAAGHCGSALAPSARPSGTGQLQQPRTAMHGLAPSKGPQRQQAERKTQHPGRALSMGQVLPCRHSQKATAQALLLTMRGFIPWATPGNILS